MTNLSSGNHGFVMLVCWTASAGTGSSEKSTTMKLNQIICSMVAVTVLAGGLAGCVTEEKKEAKLQAEAKAARG